MNSDDAMVEAVDRDAAVAFWLDHGPFAMGTNEALCQAFARHRVAAIAAARPMILEEAAKAIEPMAASDEINEERYYTASDCLETIRALQGGRG